MFFNFNKKYKNYLFFDSKIEYNNIASVYIKIDIYLKTVCPVPS